MKKFFIYLTSTILLVGVFLTGLYHHDLYTWQKPQQNIWIKNGTLFDAVSGFVKPNPGLLLSQGVIKCIGADCSLPKDIVTIDATSKSITPGLIDLHGHFFSGREYSRDDNPISVIWDQIRYLPSVRKELLNAGITSYRSLGDISPAIFDLKNALKNDQLAGPRLFIAGPIFTVAGGHPTNRKDISPWVLDKLTFQSDDPNQVSRKVAELAELGVDGIKVVYQGKTENSNDIDMPRMSLQTLQAIASAAKQHDLWLAVHSGSQSETVEAIDAGITTIEHGIRHGNAITQNTLEKIVSNHITYVPTLGKEPHGHLNIQPLVNANVTLGVGTDSAVITKGEVSYYQELERLVKAGMSDQQALLAATKNGAIALNKLSLLGTIEEGKLADLLIVDGKPWQQIGDLKNIDVVIAAGRVVRQDSL